MKLALFELVKEKPDLVLSGINHGPNLGNRCVLLRHRCRSDGRHP